jgi:carbamoyl-phosphate synthase large subunit
VPPRTVLVSSAAAKVLLVRAFRNAAPGTRVVACDASAESAALYEADAGYVVPRIDDPAVLPTLLRICERERVSLLVPTRDGELPFYAAHAALFAEQGVRVLVSSEGAVATCADKQAFIEHCARIRLPVPTQIPAGALPDRWPVFCRPRTGAAASGAMVVHTATDLRRVLADAPGTVVQEYVDAPEYSVDVLSDLEGIPLQAVVRRRERVRAGEAVVSRVENKPAVEAAALRLCESLKLVGHAVIQLFGHPSRGPLMIEANPRFGGASNLSIVAGLDSPRRILALLEGEPGARVPRPIRFGATMLRFSDDLILPAETIERRALGHSA